MEYTTEVSADVQVTGILDMRQNKISGLITDTSVYPTLPNQAASKKYVDEQRDVIIASIPDEINNGLY